MQWCINTYMDINVDSMRRRGHKKKEYYAGMSKNNNELLVATTMSSIARMLGICRQTISKHLSDTNMYESNDYIIWRNVYIDKCKKGFSLWK